MLFSVLSDGENFHVNQVVPLTGTAVSKLKRDKGVLSLLSSYMLEEETTGIEIDIKSILFGFI